MTVPNGDKVLSNGGVGTVMLKSSIILCFRLFRFFFLWKVYENTCKTQVHYLRPVKTPVAL